MTSSLNPRLALGPLLITALTAGCSANVGGPTDAAGDCRSTDTCPAPADAGVIDRGLTDLGNGSDVGPRDTAVSSVCDPNPCLNGGVCVEGDASFSCQCAPGFEGSLCETAIPRAVGLSERPTNAACIAPPRAARSGPANWVRTARSGLSGQPLMMFAEAPDGSRYEIYRGGQVYRVDPTGIRDAAPLIILDVTTTGELGLLGITLHPAFPSVPHIFFYRTTRPLNTWIHIDRYTVAPTSGGPNTAAIDPASRKAVFEFDRNSDVPFHAGGTLQFDPTATRPLLYVATGDADDQNSAQDPGSFNGKLLRFDLSDGSPTAVYPPEIVGVGFRNPFRWSFDSATGDLWIGDVGEADFEEVSFVAAADIPVSGAALNFGWPMMEGFMCRAGGTPQTNCGHPTPLVLPAHAYGRTVGVSVIGGAVYRGSDSPALVGTYFFHDFFPTGGEAAWQLDANPNEDPNVLEDDYIRTVAGTNGGFASIVEDPRGELFGVRMSGEIFQLVAGNTTQPVETLPADLSQLGCFDGQGEPLTAMIPYDVIAPLWSDGATKRRWFAVPDGSTITLNDDGSFVFPNGSVLAKEFTQDGVRVETRLMMRHPDGEWRGYTYGWLDENGQTLADAQLRPEAATVSAIAGTNRSWTYPSRGQCLSCHTSAADFVLGLEVLQLNSELTYPRTGTTANQLHTLQTIGMFDSDAERFGTAQLIAADDATSSAGMRAWSYMHSNCSGCHRPGAPGFGGRSNVPDLRIPANGTVDATELANRTCGVAAGAGDIGLGSGALLLEPGQPGDWNQLGDGGSVLYLRMAAREGLPGTTGAMPALGTEDVDPNGLALVADWIQTVSCP